MTNGKRTTVALCLALALSVTALAAVPTVMNFQGRLTNNTGSPLVSTTVSVTFTVYEAPTGGTARWTETNSVTTDANGLFGILLGTATPIPDTAFTATECWMGITVGADPESVPRTRLASLPYSYRVKSVDGAAGGAISGNTTIQNDLTVTGNIIGSTPWTPFPFAPGYQDYEDGHPGSGAQRVQYRKIGDMVYLRGTAHKSDHGAIPHAAVIGTLPSGFRPPLALDISTGFPATATIEILGPGVVRALYNTIEYQTLEGIVFSTTP